METQGGESQNTSSVNKNSNFLVKLPSKRRTWACLFVSAYAVLLSLSWKLIKAVLTWYELNNNSSSSSTWGAMYASVLLGLAFGVLSAVAALAVAVPATVVTWITVLVLLTFCGKPRKDVVVEGKKLTAEISGTVIRVLIKEGNVVAAICAVVGYFALFSKENRSSDIFDFE